MRRFTCALICLLISANIFSLKQMAFHAFTNENSDWNKCFSHSVSPVCPHEATLV